MNDQVGCGTMLLLAGLVAIWLWMGDGWATIRKWTGHETYEDQLVTLSANVKKAHIGSSSDVWLVKGNFGVPDRVALFFGYMDDWEACHEFVTAYSYQFPSDVYSCEYGN